MERPDNGLPEDFREHTRLMCDIIALAFQTDKTRVASLLLARDLSSLFYPFLDVNEAHHGASHDDTSDGYERIARFHLSQLAYLAQKLDAMPEGEGTVLDNCCLMFLSNMCSGTKHDNKKVPVVTAGGLGGTLQTGRTLDYLNAGDENRKLCSLVPRPHGPDGREAGPLRRRRHPPRRLLNPLAQTVARHESATDNSMNAILSACGVVLLALLAVPIAGRRAGCGTAEYFGCRPTRTREGPASRCARR